MRASTSSVVEGLWMPDQVLHDGLTDFMDRLEDDIIELRINKGTLYLPRKGRGDFSRPDFGRLKPPLPMTTVPKTGFIAFAKLNNSTIVFLWKGVWMKKFLFITVLITMGLFFVQIASAQDWTSLKETFRKIRSVKADFLQKKSLKILMKPLLSEGKLFFCIPDSLRWEYLNPLRSVMLQKGSTVRIYNFSEGVWKPEMPESVEATRMVLAEISQWFQGRFDESKAFKQLYSPGPPGRVTMVPGEGINRFIQRIDIVLSARPGVIDRVEIEEPGGSRTSIEFRNVEINSSFSSEVFEKP